MTTSTRRGFDHAERLEQADAFARARDEALQHPCALPPLGCGAEVGQPCSVIGHPDVPLRRQPAHLPRMRRAGLAPTSKVGDGAPRDSDRPPGAPIPRRNRHLYDLGDEPIQHPDR